LRDKNRPTDFLGVETEEKFRRDNDTSWEMGKKLSKKLSFLMNLKKILEKNDTILFAYLYGSYASNSILRGSDIDVAVYLKPSNIKEYLEKEKELTASLMAELHNDKIDLRILNVLPLLLQYNILKEGKLIFIRDELERVDFETQVMIRFFELKPYLDEYKEMLSMRIKKGF
jgi:predicted nucleotidyltransferase